MKYFHWFKGFIFVALACSVNAQGSTVNAISTKENLPNSKGGKVIVAAGEVQNYQSTANLTISGENRPLIVEKDGEVNLTAGKSIILLPGTKISAGGFLYASIEPSVKSGKHQKKEIRLVTIEENEKIQEQASLSQAGILFSPFPKSVKGSLHAGDAEQGYFNISANILSAVAPEQHRKVALISLPLHEITRQQVFSNLTILPVTSTFRAETMRVLRL
jgi:hypothetical protein